MNLEQSYEFNACYPGVDITRLRRLQYTYEIILEESTTSVDHHFFLKEDERNEDVEKIAQRWRKRFGKQLMQRRLYMRRSASIALVKYSVALSVGGWFFDRVGVSAIDYPYPYKCNKREKFELGVGIVTRVPRQIWWLIGVVCRICHMSHGDWVSSLLPTNMSWKDWMRGLRKRTLANETLPRGNRLEERRLA
ncbi:hypothetical protein Scep_028140 [Stephania cephalantha]|uniref:Uncharacterized protein n=1 Tax=Stephania cephalantha TaxID=152367 RepID=A0AAP0ED03_9MAGN